MMAGRRFYTSDYFDTRCAQMKPLLEFAAKTLSEARDWRTRAAAKARDLLGELPDWTPLEAEVFEAVDAGAYVRQKVIFDSDPLSSVPGYILIPKGLQGPAPALLCLHGHGPGCCAVANVIEARPGYSEDDVRACIENRNYAYAHHLAEQGYVTFTLDFRGFGERKEPSLKIRGRDTCDAQFIRGCVLGINLLALNVHDTHRAADYLCDRPEVDSERIGCVGFDFGGTIAIWATALDKRVKAATVSGCLCEMEASAVHRGNACGLQGVPALRRYFDLADIAALVAPRPLLVESGLGDEMLPIEPCKRAFHKVAKAYEAWGEPRRIKHDFFEGGHRFSGAAVGKWFEKWL